VEIRAMIDYQMVRDESTGEAVLEVPLTGTLLLDFPLFNKGSAFPEHEREQLGLRGLLPPHVSTLEEQLARRYQEYRQRPTDLDRHIYLRDLQERNETLFYRLERFALALRTEYNYLGSTSTRRCSHASLFQRSARAHCPGRPTTRVLDPPHRATILRQLVVRRAPVAAFPPDRFGNTQAPWWRPRTQTRCCRRGTLARTR
jgi:hypothetical protein